MTERPTHDDRRLQKATFWLTIAGVAASAVAFATLLVVAALWFKYWQEVL